MEGALTFCDRIWTSIFSRSSPLQMPKPWRELVPGLLVAQVVIKNLQRFYKKVVELDDVV